MQESDVKVSNICSPCLHFRNMWGTLTISMIVALALGTEVRVLVDHWHKWRCVHHCLLLCTIEAKIIRLQTLPFCTGGIIWNCNTNQEEELQYRVPCTDCTWNKVAVDQKWSVKCLKPAFLLNSTRRCLPWSQFKSEWWASLQKPLYPAYFLSDLAESLVLSLENSKWSPYWKF